MAKQATIAAAKTEQAFVEVPLNKIRESKTNPRHTFDPKQMAELTASVKEHGVLQPILVRLVSDADADPRYEVVAGARRFRASKEAERPTIPCVVREMTDKQVLEVQFIENLQRSDLTPIEEGLGFAELIKKHGYTAETLAKRLDKSKGYIYARMKLAELPPKARALVESGRLDTSTALLVARIPIPKLAEEAAGEVLKGRFHGEGPMSHKQAVDFIRQNYQCDLQRACFPTEDAKLVPAAGACAACPKRAGNQAAVYGEADAKACANVCTDPKCYQSKIDAFFAVKKAEVLKKGGKVIEGPKAQNVIHNRQELVDPAENNYDDEKQRKWSTLAKGKEPAPVLLQGRDGEPVLRWKRDDAVAAAKANGYEVRRTSAAAHRNPQQKAMEAAHKRRRAAIELVLPKLAEKAADLDVAQAWRLVILQGLRGHEQTKAVGKRLGIDFDRDNLTTFDAKKLQAIAIELVAIEYASSTWSSGYGGNWTKICKALRLDMKQAEQQAAAAQKAKGKAKKPTWKDTVRTHKQVQAAIQGKAKKGAR